MSKTPPGKVNVFSADLLFVLLSIRVRSTPSAVKSRSSVTVFRRLSSTWLISIGRRVSASATARWCTSNFQSARAMPTVWPTPWNCRRLALLSNWISPVAATRSFQPKL